MKPTLLFCDAGAFYVSMAQRLTAGFDVLYWNAWNLDRYPESYKKSIAQGIPGITKVDDILTAAQTADYIMFPDCNSGKFQDALQNIYGNTFGSGLASKLETSRSFFKNWLKEQDLPIIPYVEREGVDELLAYVEKQTETVYIKHDTRGDFETYAAKDFVNTKRFFDMMRVRWGNEEKKKKFIIEQGLEACEAGIDTYSVGLLYPQMVLTGIELKDAGYLGRMMNRNDLPKEFQEINDKMAKYIGENTPATFWSNEIRVGLQDKKWYLNDATLRLPIPPSESEQVLWKNLPAIIKGAMEGELVEPEYDFEWVAQIILKSHDVSERTLRVNFPDKYADNIRFYNYYIDDTGTNVIPLGIPADDIVASVVGVGNSKESAIDQCLSIAREVSTDGLYYEENAFIKVEDIISDGEKVGISFFND